MPSSDGIVFVLWGSQFDEAPAAIFITELRTAGLRVQVVGLHGRHISGAHGLVLKPDIFLDEAMPLAPQTVCLIIPAAVLLLDHFAHDPRLSHFLAVVRNSNARIIVGGIDAAAASPLLSSDEVEVYAGGEAVLGFARRLAGEL